jgi:lipoprotein-anchoring transpeptidase ErfK/SrfK
VRRAVVVCLAVAAAVVAVVAARPDGQHRPAPAAGRAAADPLAATRDLPPTPAAAFTVGKPVPARPSSRHATTWIAVRRTVTARRRPSPAAPPAGRLPRRTVEGTTNLVTAHARHVDRHGRLWVQVDLPVLPNGTRGWVPRSALGATGTVTTRLTVDLRTLTATLTRNGRRLMRARVGVGAPGSVTPRGTFLVRDKLTRFRSAFYGPVAFGTTARSATETDWPGGGFVGIHGTDAPQLVPGRVSHGCIRLRNADVLKLARLMPVGTPLVIT